MTFICVHNNMYVWAECSLEAIIFIIINEYQWNIFFILFNIFYFREFQIFFLSLCVQKKKEEFKNTHKMLSYIKFGGIEFLSINVPLEWIWCEQKCRWYYVLQQKKIAWISSKWKIQEYNNQALKMRSQPNKCLLCLK